MSDTVIPMQPAIVEPAKQQPVAPQYKTWNPARQKFVPCWCYRCFHGRVDDALNELVDVEALTKRQAAQLVRQIRAAIKDAHSAMIRVELAEAKRSRPVTEPDESD